MKRAIVSEPPGFGGLPKPEQIRYLQALWDRISENPSDVPVPESHLELVEQRLADLRRNRHLARPASEVLDRLSKKRR